MKRHEEEEDRNLRLQLAALQEGPHQMKRHKEEEDQHLTLQLAALQEDTHRMNLTK
jgi:hypothetical protein